MTPAAVPKRMQSWLTVILMAAIIMAGLYTPVALAQEPVSKEVCFGLFCRKQAPDTSKYDAMLAEIIANQRIQIVLLQQIESGQRSAAQGIAALQQGQRVLPVQPYKDASTLPVQPYKEAPTIPVQPYKDAPVIPAQPYKDAPVIPVIPYKDVQPLQVQPDGSPPAARRAIPAPSGAPGRVFYKDTVYRPRN